MYRFGGQVLGIPLEQPAQQGSLRRQPLAVGAKMRLKDPSGTLHLAPNTDC